MKEAEFDERILAIRKDINEMYNHPLVHLNRKTDAGVVPYETTTQRLLIQIAANINQLNEGIKVYSRPSNWDLIEEGIPSADSGTKTPKMP